jgi:hypothetical protein
MSIGQTLAALRIVSKRNGCVCPQLVAMTDPTTELLRAVDQAEPGLRALSSEQTAKRPAPGKWSPREILGHLIDSASNNHQRFVRAADQDDLVFPGYDQDRWVERQGYQEAPWPELVSLWALYNRHLARVIARLPAAVRMREHTRHNLDQRAFRAVPAGQPATLQYFLLDYVEHLRHHLKQILGPRGPLTASS